VPNQQQSDIWRYLGDDRRGFVVGNANIYQFYKNYDPRRGIYIDIPAAAARSDGHAGDQAAGNPLV
jgi:hypothetical protein